MRVLVARGRIRLLLVWGRGRRLLLHTSFRTRARLSMSDRIALETGIPRLWDNAILVSRRTGDYTQFIPPHPSEGLRNKFQFRGAIQALPATQIGQRGQSVGRSQE